MAGGIAPIDFWGVFNAAADSSARRRAMEAERKRSEQQLKLNQQQFDMEQDRAKAEQAKTEQLRESVSRYYGGQPGMLQMLFPQQFGELEKTRVDQARQQAQLELDQAKANEPKQTPDMIEYRQALADPKFAAYQEKMAKARGLQVNVGTGTQDLAPRVVSKLQGDLESIDQSLAGIDAVEKLAGGDLAKVDDFFTAQSNVDDAATAAQIKAGGVFGKPSPERKANYERQKQLEQQLAGLMRSTKQTLHDETGSDELFESILSTKGIGTGAALKQMREALITARAVKAKYLQSGAPLTDGVEPKAPEKKGPKKDGPPPGARARLERDYRLKRITKEVYEAGLAELGAKP